MNAFSITPTQVEEITVPESFEKLSPVELRARVEKLISEHYKLLKTRHTSATSFSEFCVQVVKDYHMEVMYEVTADNTRGYYYLLFKTALESRINTYVQEPQEEPNSWFGGLN